MVSNGYPLYTGLPGYGRRVKRHKAILVPIVWRPMNDVLPANPRRQPFARFLRLKGFERLFLRNKFERRRNKFCRIGNHNPVGRNANSDCYADMYNTGKCRALSGKSACEIVKYRRISRLTCEKEPSYRLKYCLEY